LQRRRPGLAIELFGDPRGAGALVEHRDLGVLAPGDLAQAYARATVGMVLSMTNYSLIAQEMLACGLPCVELDTPSTRVALGPSEAAELAPFGVQAIATALERLLDDPELRERRAAAGVKLVEERTWGAAAEQVEAGLREALRLASE
jgi:glycosyltransferase involved in cell wall biosynthesis